MLLNNWYFLKSLKYSTYYLILEQGFELYKEMWKFLHNQNMRSNFFQCLLKLKHEIYLEKCILDCY